MGSTNFRYCQSETMSSIDLQALWFVSPMQNGASQPLFSKGERRGDKTISPLCKCCTRPRLNSSFTNPRCNLYLETRWSGFPHDENSSGRNRVHTCSSNPGSNGIFMPGHHGVFAICSATKQATKATESKSVFDAPPLIYSYSRENHAL